MRPSVRINPRWNLFLVFLSTIFIPSTKGYVNLTSTPPGWTTPYSVFRSLPPGSWSYIFDLNLASNFSSSFFLLTLDVHFFGVSYASILLSSNTPYQDASAYQIDLGLGVSSIRKQGNWAGSSSTNDQVTSTSITDLTSSTNGDGSVSYWILYSQGRVTLGLGMAPDQSTLNALKQSPVPLNYTLPNTLLNYIDASPLKILSIGYGVYKPNPPAQFLHSQLFNLIDWVKSPSVAFTPSVWVDPNGMTRVDSSAPIARVPSSNYFIFSTQAHIQWDLYLRFTPYPSDPLTLTWPAKTFLIALGNYYNSVVNFINDNTKYETNNRIESNHYLMNSNRSTDLWIAWVQYLDTGYRVLVGPGVQPSLSQIKALMDPKIDLRTFDSQTAPVLGTWSSVQEPAQVSVDSIFMGSFENFFEEVYNTQFIPPNTYIQLLFSSSPFLVSPTKPFSLISYDSLGIQSLQYLDRSSLPTSVSEFGLIGVLIFDVSLVDFVNSGVIQVYSNYQWTTGTKFTTTQCLAGFVRFLKTPGMDFSGSLCLPNLQVKSDFFVGLSTNITMDFRFDSNSSLLSNSPSSSCVMSQPFRMAPSKQALPPPPASPSTLSLQTSSTQAVPISSFILIISCVVGGILVVIILTGGLFVHLSKNTTAKKRLVERENFMRNHLASKLSSPTSTYPLNYPSSMLSGSLQNSTRVTSGSREATGTRAEVSNNSSSVLIQSSCASPTSPTYQSSRLSENSNTSNSNGGSNGQSAGYNAYIPGYVRARTPSDFVYQSNENTSVTRIMAENTFFGSKTMTLATGDNAISLPVFLKVDNLYESVYQMRNLAVGGFASVKAGVLLPSNTLSLQKYLEGGRNQVAVKLLLNTKSQMPDAVLSSGGSSELEKEDWESFKLECSLLYSLQSAENVVQLLGFSDDPVAIILPLYDGSLYDLLFDISGPPKWVTMNVLLTASTDIARGMTQVHANSICHLDLKSPNILYQLLPSAKFLIADFGIACVVKDLEAGKSQQVHALRTSAKFGISFRYTCPEIFLTLRLGRISNENELLFKADIYSYSMILYEMVEKTIPWKQLNQDLVEEQVLGGRRPPWSFKQASSSSSSSPSLILLKTLAERCWAQDPESRPAFSSVYSELDQNMDDSFSESSESSEYVTPEVPSETFHSNPSSPPSPTSTFISPKASLSMEFSPPLSLLISEPISASKSKSTSIPLVIPSLAATHTLPPPSSLPNQDAYLSTNNFPAPSTSFQSNYSSSVNKSTTSIDDFGDFGIVDEPETPNTPPFPSTLPTQLEVSCLTLPQKMMSSLSVTNVTSYERLSQIQNAFSLHFQSSPLPSSFPSPSSPYSTRIQSPSLLPPPPSKKEDIPTLTIQIALESEEIGDSIALTNSQQSRFGSSPTSSVSPVRTGLVEKSSKIQVPNPVLKDCIWFDLWHQIANDSIYSENSAHKFRWRKSSIRKLFLSSLDIHLLDEGFTSLIVSSNQPVAVGAILLPNDTLINSNSLLTLTTPTTTSTTVITNLTTTAKDSSLLTKSKLQNELTRAKLLVDLSEEELRKKSLSDLNPILMDLKLLSVRLTESHNILLDSKEQLVMDAEMHNKMIASLVSYATVNRSLGGGFGNSKSSRKFT